MKKSELTAALAACRATAEVDPAAALQLMARLNVQLDVGLGRLSKSEGEILLVNPEKALVRLTAQAAALAAGTLIL